MSSIPVLSVVSRLFGPSIASSMWKEVNLANIFRQSKANTNSKSTDAKAGLDMKKVEGQDALLALAAGTDGKDVGTNGKEVLRTYGGLFEDRTELWAGFESHGRPMIHLGIDFNNLDEKQPVHSLTKGKVVHVMKDTSKFNGWGGRIIVKAPSDVYLLYGHLAHEDLVGLGTELKAGDRIGTVGNADENGAWFRHLHVQSMNAEFIKKFDNLDDLDGYAFEKPEGILDPLTL